MSWLVDAVAEFLNGEPIPGTPAHREAVFQSVRERNAELTKPPEQRDTARVLEVTKRNMRLRAQSYRVRKGGMPAPGRL